MHITLIPLENIAISQSNHSTKPLICTKWIVGMTIDESKT